MLRFSVQSILSTSANENQQLSNDLPYEPLDIHSVTECSPAVERNTAPNTSKFGSAAISSADGEMGSGTNTSDDREGTEDDTKCKPPYSYIALIAMALLGTPETRLTMKQICDFICRCFPYYRERFPRWQKSIMTTLSLNDCFVKVARERNGGRVNYWMLDPASEHMFEDGSFVRRRTRFKKHSLMEDRSGWMSLYGSLVRRPWHCVTPRQIFFRPQPLISYSPSSQPLIMHTTPLDWSTTFLPFYARVTMSTTTASIDQLNLPCHSSVCSQPLCIPLCTQLPPQAAPMNAESEARVSVWPVPAQAVPQRNTDVNNQSSITIAERY